MSNKTTLKRLEQRAGRRRWALDRRAQAEQTRLDELTDEELEAQIAHMVEVLKTLDAAGALDSVLDAELLELLAAQGNE